jgi:H-type lectin domain
MKRFAGRIGVAQGSEVLFSDFANDGVMWSGDGPREVRRVLVFAEAFAEAPAVLVGISMWDIDHKVNSRADIGAEDITEAGFQIVFRTWGDSRIARIRADWTAIGPLRDDEDWDVV